MTTFMWTTGDLATLSPMLGDLRDANIDVIQSYSITPASGVEATTAYLDALYAVGLGALLNVTNLGRNLVYDRPSKTLTAEEVAAITAYASTYADHPALWGYYADDEGAASNYPIASRQQVYDALKAGAPSAQVLEAHYRIESGAYSPDVHDWFVVHAGADSNSAYCYKYDTYPNAPDYGCIDFTTGLVTNRTREATMLAAFESNLSSIKATLDSNGEINYSVLFGAFKQTVNGSMEYFAMPPAAADGYDGGVTRMWDAAVNAGMDSHAAWFLWTYPAYISGSPFEHLEGVGQTGYESQRAEVVAIAASVGGGSGYGDFDLRLSGSTGDFDLRLQSLVTTRRRQRIALGGV